MDIRECKVCKEKFEAKKYNQKYCGSKCRNKHWGRKGYLKNKEKILFKIKNDDEYQKKQKKYRKTDKFKQHRNKYLRLKRKTDPIYRVKYSIWGRIRIDPILMGKSKIRDIEKYLDYTISELWQYLEKTIEDCFSIKDYLNGDLEMDHIIPYSWYIIENPGDEEFKKCWDFKNLRLIHKNENRKRNRNIFDWHMIKEKKLYDILPLGPKEIYEKWSNNNE